MTGAHRLGRVGSGRTRLWATTAPKAVQRCSPSLSLLPPTTEEESAMAANPDAPDRKDGTLVRESAGPITDGSAARFIQSPALAEHRSNRQANPRR
jgi:hypothetical protein